MAKAKEEKKKPVPMPCVCGRGGIIAHRKGGGVMCSCPNPVRCPSGPRTRWCSSEEAAVEAWNYMIESEERAGHGH